MKVMKILLVFTYMIYLAVHYFYCYVKSEGGFYSADYVAIGIVTIMFIEGLCI